MTTDQFKINLETLKLKKKEAIKGIERQTCHSCILIKPIGDSRQKKTFSSKKNYGTNENTLENNNMPKFLLWLLKDQIEIKF